MPLSTSILRPLASIPPSTIDSPPGSSFYGNVLADLEPLDRRLFEVFGHGQSCELPFACLHHAFEEQAAENPFAIAAQHLDEAITYRQLDRGANRLARELSQHGVVPGDNVALFLHRSIPMLVGMLAALKCGAAYVPQHVGVAPDAQLRHVIGVAKTRVILTLSSLRHLVPVPEGHVCIEIDAFLREGGDVPADESFEPVSDLDPDLACFVLFTSGTTGMPNGVQVTHRNVCNILHTTPGNLGIRPGLRVSQILSIAFDMAAWEIWGCLSHGGTLTIRGKSIQAAVADADVIIATPSILARIDPDLCVRAKVVAVAGEPCPRPLADRWSTFCTFYNCCGPTETTIVNTMQRYVPWNERLTIGKPTPNNTVYVLDENLRPLPIGEIGEMWAGGDCVTAGYLDNDTLNRDRYRPDPFLGRGMMFRTRDLGRWTPDGELEHHGRTDDQVKVRGFRVELDSVSRVIESLPSCTHAVTLKLDERSLVSFVCPIDVDPAGAQRAVAASLPYYCVPELVVGLEELPMTSRGKVDKRALRELLAASDATIAGDDR